MRKKKLNECKERGGRRELEGKVVPLVSLSSLVVLVDTLFPLASHTTLLGAYEAEGLADAGEVEVDALRVVDIAGGAILGDAIAGGGRDCVDISTEEDKLPAELGLLRRDERLDLGSGEAATAVLLTIGDDDEDDLLGAMLGRLRLLDVDNLVDSVAKGVEEGSATTREIVVGSERADGSEVDAVVEELVVVVKKDRRDTAGALLLLLLGEHRVEAADSVSLEARHRTALVENEYEL